MANAAPASSQMPAVPPMRAVHGTMPGVDRNIPITAQNTASCVTRGFVNARYCETRLPEGEVSVVLSMEIRGVHTGIKQLWAYLSCITRVSVMQRRCHAEESRRGRDGWRRFESLA